MRNFNRAIDRATRRLDGFGNNATRSQRTVSTANIAIGNAYTQMAQFAITAITKVIDKTVEWSVASSKMAINFENDMTQVTNIFGSAADSVNNFINSQARGFGMARSEAAKYAKTLGGMSENILGQQKGAEMTQKLLKQSAIIAAKEGRSMEDVMIRIASGMRGETEAIEDLRVYVSESMIHSTQAFQKFGAASGKTFGELDEKLKQQIRLYAIIEQSMANFGTKLDNTVSVKMLKLNAALRDASLNLGQAFLPLIERALPHFINLANGLEIVLGKLAHFSNLLFGVQKTSGQATDGQKKVADSIKKSGDAAKKSLGSFDELNTLQEKMADTTKTTQTDNAPSKSKKDDGFIGPIPPTEMEASIIALRKALKELNTSFLELKKTTKPIWEPISEGIGKAFNEQNINVIKGLSKVLRLFNEDMKNITKGIEIVKKVPEMFDDLTNAENWELFWGEVKDVAATGLSEAYESIKTKTKKAIDEIWKNTDDDTKVWWKSISKRVSDTATDIKDLKWSDIETAISGMWKDVRKKTNDWWWSIKQRVKLTAEDITGLKWSDIETSVTDMWKSLSMKTATIWDGIKLIIINSVNSIVDGINTVINKINSANSALGGYAPNIPTITRLSTPQKTDATELVREFNQVPPSLNRGPSEQQQYDFGRGPSEQGREITINIPVAIEGEQVGKAAARYNERTGDVLIEGGGFF